MMAKKDRRSSGSRGLRSPPVFRWALFVLLNREDRRAVLSDLDELYRHRHARDGAAPAAEWRTRQFRRYPVQLVVDRMRRTFAPRHRRKRSGVGPLRPGALMLARVWRDVRIAGRGFRRTPGFVLVATLTLALGIGANTAIFSVVNGVLLDPLPYPEPDNLMAVVMTDPERGETRLSWSVPNLRDAAEQSRSLESLAGFQYDDMTLTGAGEPVLVYAVRVTDGLLHVFREPPLLGRDIREDETRAGGPAVALLSHSFWQERLGGDASVIGRSIELSGRSYEIVGVTRPGFHFPQHAELWIPGQWDEEQYPRGRYFLRAVGRLGPAATEETARAELSAIAARLAEAYPEANGSRRADLVSLEEETVGSARLSLLVLMGAVGMVLLIACGNVANLLLARGSTRVGEIAVRSTMGASRGAILHQLVVESLLLSVAGGTLGVFLAVWGVRGLTALSPGNIPRLDNVAVDGVVLLFTGILTLVVAVLFGLAPAFRLSRVSIATVVREGRDAEVARQGRGLTRSVLLAAETGVSLVLLVGAGLLLRSFLEIRSVKLGFDPDNVQQFTLTLPDTRYTDEQVIGFYGQLEDRLAAVPGVESVGMIYGSPLGRTHTSIGFDIVGKPASNPGRQPFLLVRRVTPGYFRTMRIQLLRGRGFDVTDRANSARVAVLSETAAERYWPGEDPIGQQFSFDPEESPWTIVGIARDVRSLELTTAPEPEVYLPHTQSVARMMTAVMRVAPGVPGLVPALHREVAALDPNIALYWVETFQELMEDSVAGQRFYLSLVGLFAGLAVVLALVGLYGVVAYLVSRRAREIGIRLALGARRENVLWLVVGQGMLPAVVGTVLGIAAAIGGTRVLASLLYQVKPWDPATFAAGTAALLFVALLACAIPAHTATHMSPMEAIRAE